MTRSSSKHEFPAGLPTSVRRLAPLMLSMFLIGSAEVVAGPMMTDMGAHFGVPAAQIAWLPAAYALVYGLLAPLLGPLSDRFGRKALLVPGLIGFGLAGLGIALAPSFPIALAVAAMGGLCAAAMQPNALAIVNDTIERPEDQATALGRVFLGLTLSFVAVPVASAFLAARVDWRASYALMAVIAFATAYRVARLPVPAAIPRRGAGFLASFHEAFSAYSVRRRLASSYLWVGLSVGILAVLAEILRRRYGLSTEAAGLIVGAFGATTLAGNSLVGPAVGGMGSRPRLVLAGVVACTLGVLVIGVLPVLPLALAVIAVLVWALAYGAAAPVHHALLSGLSSSVRGTITALNASLLNLGIVTVTFAAGRFFDTLGVEIVAGSAVLGMGIALVLLLTIREGSV